MKHQPGIVAPGRGVAGVLLFVALAAAACESPTLPPVAEPPTSNAPLMDATDAAGDGRRSLLDLFDDPLIDSVLQSLREDEGGFRPSRFHSLVDLRREMGSFQGAALQGDRAFERLIAMQVLELAVTARGSDVPLP